MQIDWILHLHYLKHDWISKASVIQPSFSYQDVELLPALGKVDPVLDGVGVPDVDKGEVLQHQPDVGDAGRRGLAQCRPKPTNHVVNRE
jgi:hypothetical protein